MDRTPRTWALDSLRGLAALAVVAFHYLHRGPGLYPELGPVRGWAAWGQHGVDIFFIISGLVIFMSASRLGARNFALRRAIRLYPAYVLAVMLTFAVVSVAGLPGREVSFRDALLNLTMMQGFFGVPYVDGAYWTLTVEISFYVQVALLAIGIRRFRLPSGIVVAAWIVFTTSVGLFVAPIPGQEAWATVLRPAWMPVFGLGIALSLLLKRDWFGSGLVGAVSLVAAALIAGDRFAPLVVCLAVVACFLALPFRARAAKANRFLGDLSYPLYLLHQNIGYVALLGLAGLGWGQVPSVAVVALLVICLAAALHRWYEAPVRAWLTQRVAQHRAQRAADPRPPAPLVQ
jgi:peptidoglycan/LPS O-acetylase OafA/YrhL